MDSVRTQLVKMKSFTATILVPATTPDGTSLEERMNVWFSASGERRLISTHYFPLSTAFTAIVFYTE